MSPLPFSSQPKPDSKRCLRILGIDPGLVQTGWGLISQSGSRLAHIAHGAICPDKTKDFPSRLLYLFDTLSEIIQHYQPDETAVEEIFVNMNATSTLKLGHARAACLIAPAKLGMPIAEYATRKIKKALVGTGKADKDQIGFMVRRLLPNCGEPGADAADALAVAITHAHLRGRISTVQNSAIEAGSLLQRSLT